LNFHIQIDGIDDQLRARYIIATHDEVSKMNDRAKDNKSPSTSKQGEYQSIKLGRCIAIIEAPVYFKRRQSPKTAQQNSQDNIGSSEDKPKEDGDTSSPIEDESDGLVDSAILVFPPSASDSQASLKHPEVVTAFISGPAALSCPDGKRKENKSYLGIFLFWPSSLEILYLTTTLSDGASPEQVLQPYLDALLRLNRQESDASPLVASVFYAQRSSSYPDVPNPSNHPSTVELHKGHGTIDLRQPEYHLAEFGDRAAVEAERVFWAIIGDLDLDGRTCARPVTSGDDNAADSAPATEEADLVKRFWPPLILENEDSSW
jgi:hypothetical protein